MDAAARGRGANSANRPCQPAPHSASRTASNCQGGIGVASARSRPRSSVSSGGIKAPASMDRSCPNFMAAPRISDSRSAVRSMLPGVRRRSPRAGRSPRATRRAPSASASPARPTASPPSRVNRAKRPAGTGRALGGTGHWDTPEPFLSRTGTEVLRTALTYAGRLVRRGLDQTPAYEVRPGSGL